MEELDSKQVFHGIWRINWRILGMFAFKQHKWLYYIYSVFVNFTVSVIAPITFIVYLFLAPSWRAVLENLQFNLTFILCSFKQWVIWWNKPKLLKIEEHFEILDTRAKRNPAEVAYLKKDVKFWTRVFQSFTLMYVTCMPFFMAGALMGRQRRLMFFAWYPFDTEKYFAYAFGYQFYSLFIATFQNSGNDCYPFLYLGIIKSHVGALNLRVSQIGAYKNTNETEHVQELVACIADHRKIIETLKLAKSAISVTLGMQIIAQAFIICDIVVVLVFFPTSATEIASACYYLVMVFSEITPVCYVGSLLINEFKELTSSIYKCNWIEKSRRFKTILLIFMANTQPQQIVHAGKIFTLEVPTALSILQFTFSLFTMLRNMR